MDQWATSKTTEEFNTKTFDPDSLPPIGFYTFELVDKEPDEPQKKEYNESGDKYRARFYFKLVANEEWEGFIAKVRYGISLHEKSYFRPVVEALIGRTLGPAERVGWNDDPTAVNEQGEPAPVVGIGNKRMGAVLQYDEPEGGGKYPVLKAPTPLSAPRTNPKKAKAAGATKDGPAPF